jgi:hypothetical protein
MKVKPEDSLKIENIVASAKVTDYLDLPALASQIKDAEYNKKRFPGVVIRMQEPKIAALVFGSGKVVLTRRKEHREPLGRPRDPREPAPGAQHRHPAEAHLQDPEHRHLGRPRLGDQPE